MEPPEYAYPMDYYPNGHFSINYQAVDHWVLSKDYLARQPKNLDYISDIECPMFYIRGAAHISLIEQVKSRTADGRFYSCPTPDGYSGIVLSGEVEKFYFSGESFTINGVSPASQGIAYIKKDKDAVENSKEFFKFSENKMMHPILASQPYSPLLSLMTVDYLMTAKDLPGWKGEFPEIDMKEALRKGIGEMARSYDDSAYETRVVDNGRNRQTAYISLRSITRCYEKQKNMQFQEWIIRLQLLARDYTLMFLI